MAEVPDHVLEALADLADREVERLRREELSQRTDTGFAARDRVLTALGNAERLAANARWR